ncbi:MAG: hypothetical protein NTU88_10705 [Armatimonadetes bacterium]|nr:hypothetical protein [Armatimonadota bacterium]
MRRLTVVAILLILAVALMPAQPALPQETATKPNPMTITQGMVRTDAGEAAASVALDLPNLVGERFIVQVDKRKESGRLFDYWTSVQFVTGGKDAFNGVVATLSGNVMFYHTTGTNKEFDEDRPFHAVPISLGFESNGQFNDLNVLAEIGYVPFDLRENSKYSLGFNPRVGIFLQAGRKFKLEDASPRSGGAADESEEKPNSNLLRVKAFASGNIEISRGKLHLWPGVAGWYDVVNKVFYRHVEAVLRYTLSEDKYLDIWKYEKGSGPPNFNKGDQYSTGLTVQF